MTTKLATYTAVSLAASALMASAGESVASAKDCDTKECCGDWCTSLKSIGKLYKNSDNPYIQEVKVFGRAQYQWGWTGGEYSEGNGVTDSFGEQGDEMRRLRVGAQVKFLNGFKLKGNINLEEGGFRNHEFGYNDFDELKLSYTFGDLGAFEDTTVTYGRHKIAMSAEGYDSSKKIKTIERSNIANLFYASARQTGVTFNSTVCGVDYALGVYSSDEDEMIGNWDDGVTYYAHAGFEALDGEFLLQGIYNDVSGNDDDQLGYEWGLSAAYTRSFGCWDVLTNVLYGDGDNGSQYGVVILPSTYLIEDTLELVFRYQYAGSDDEGIKINSRNIRNAYKADETDYGSIDRGDSNHTLYAGLNYYLCGHNAKFMFGVEGETLDGGDADVDLEAVTIWTGFRAYF